MFNTLRRLALALVLASVSTVVTAQAPNLRDEGRQLLEQRRARELEERLLQETPPVEQPQIPSASARPEDVEEVEPTFLIERITLKDNSILKGREVRALVQPFIGKRLGTNRVNLLLRRLTHEYVERGYVTTRVYLTRQNLASGTLVVTVVEGRIEEIRVNGVKPRSRRGLVLAFPTGGAQTLRLQDLEQGIDQMNRLPSNHAELQIGPGAQPGSSVVNINNKPERRLRAVAGTDNYGQEVTGMWRLRAGVEADNLLGLYESINLTYVGSRDTNAALLSTSLPVGYNTFSYNYYYSEFVNVIADAALLYGQSQGHTFAWNRVMSRSAAGKSSLDVSLGLRESRRDIDDIQLTPQRLTVLRIGANRLQRFGRGFVLADAGVSTGLDAFNATDDPNGLPRDAAHAQYVKADLTFNANLQIGERTSVSAQLAGQYANEALFSSEQIFIGGASTVRGFPEGLIAGDRGAFVRNELQYNPARSLNLPGLQARLQPFVFVDGGSVEQIALGKFESLLSTGLGLRAVGRRVSAEIAAAQPLDWPSGTGIKHFRIHAALNITF